MGPILVVDGEPLWRERALGLLTEAGFIARAAANREAALQELSVASYALMLLDLSHDGRSGLHTLASARALRPEMPIVIFTALADGLVEAAALRHGAAAVIDKADAASQLIPTVTRLLRAER